MSVRPYPRLADLHRVSTWRAPTLPAVALLYLAMTVDSARRHHAGRGSLWKGRVG